MNVSFVLPKAFVISGSFCVRAGAFSGILLFDFAIFKGFLECASLVLQRSLVKLLSLHCLENRFLVLCPLWWLLPPRFHGTWNASCRRRACSVIKAWTFPCLQRDGLCSFTHSVFYIRASHLIVQIASCSNVPGQEATWGLTASLCIPCQALHLVLSCVPLGDPFLIHTKVSCGPAASVL